MTWKVILKVAPMVFVGLFMGCSGGKDKKPLGTENEQTLREGSENALSSGIDSKNGKEKRRQLAQLERQPTAEPAVSPEVQEEIAAALSAGDFEKQSSIYLAILYYLDQPAHKAAVFKWLEDNEADILFHDETFGYVDVQTTWENADKLARTNGMLGLPAQSFMKLELEGFYLGKKKPAGGQQAPVPIPQAPAQDKEEPSEAPQSAWTFSGEMHNAGFGAKITEFKAAAAKDLGLQPQEISGKGTKVAVFDVGYNLSWSATYQDRLVDAVIGGETVWIWSEEPLNDWLKNSAGNGADVDVATLKTELGLEEVPDSAKVGSMNEQYSYVDLNRSGEAKDDIRFVIWEEEGVIKTKWRVHPKLPFGDTLLDFKVAREAGLARFIDMQSGLHPQAAKPLSVMAVKLRKSGDYLEVAPFGFANSGEHGIANLHMIGGNYQVGSTGKTYQGVAPETEFVVAQTNPIHVYSQVTYVSLARNIINATHAGVDVLDLDIYTPGNRKGSDLLDRLLCRVVTLTDVIPVVAAHNYGPISQSIQNLAQSPCALTIGANYTAESVALESGSPIKDLSENGLIPASYSGRGFAKSGILKPDLLAPAYGFTPYGSTFARFNGTSGATPTVAGAIALLKQVARIKGIELDFERTKFLLQGSSQHPGDDFVRTGYGHLNLLSAWEMLKGTIEGFDSAAPVPSLEPLMLTVSGVAERISSLPERKARNITLRNETTGQNDSAQLESMDLWIELPNWLPEGTVEFYDRLTQQWVTSLKLEIPMRGEAVNLSYRFNFSQQQWDALPTGDSIAVIKGVREQWAGRRNVDVTWPLEIVKGSELTEKVYSVNSLSMMRPQYYHFNTQPGDVIQLDGMLTCDGGALDGVSMPANRDVSVIVNNGEDLPAPSNREAIYNPLRLSGASLFLAAKGGLMTVVLDKYYTQDCAGPVSGLVKFKRLRFSTRNTSTSLLVDSRTEARSLFLRTELALEGAPFLGGETSGSYLSVSAGSSSLIVKSRFSESDLLLDVPPGATSVKITADDPSNFFGIIQAIKADDEIDYAGLSTSSGHGESGFASINRNVNAGYVGLYWSVIQPTTAKIFVSKLGSSTYSVEFGFAAPESWKSTMQGFAHSYITYWDAGTARTVDMILPAFDIDSRILAVVPASEWNYSWTTELVISHNAGWSPGGELPKTVLMKKPLTVDLVGFGL